VHQIAARKEGHTVKVVYIGAADGTVYPPVFIFDGVREFGAVKEYPGARQIMKGGVAARLAENERKAAAAGLAVSRMDGTTGVMKAVWHACSDHLLECKEKSGEEEMIALTDNANEYFDLHTVRKLKAKKLETATLPRATSHQMQPLDVAYFSPWGQRMDKKVLMNPGVHERDIPRLAYEVDLEIKASGEKAGKLALVGGFKEAGIWPPNRHVHTDAKFAIADSMIKRESKAETAEEAAARKAKEAAAQAAAAMKIIGMDLDKLDAKLSTILKKDVLRAEPVMALSSPEMMDKMATELQEKQEKAQAKIDRKKEMEEKRKKKAEETEAKKKEKEKTQAEKAAAKAQAEATKAAVAVAKKGTKRVRDDGAEPTAAGAAQDAAGGAAGAGGAAAGAPAAAAGGGGAPRPEKLARVAPAPVGPPKKQLPKKRGAAAKSTTMKID
jgi:hypothetical protein